MSAQPDPYAALGVPREATAAEVHQAFRRRLREYHPDTRPQRDDANESASDEALQRVLAAYEYLRQPIAGLKVDEPTDEEGHSSVHHPSGAPPPTKEDPSLRATPVRWAPASDVVPSHHTVADVRHRVLRLDAVLRRLIGH